MPTLAPARCSSQKRGQCCHHPGPHAATVANETASNAAGLYGDFPGERCHLSELLGPLRTAPAPCGVRPHRIALANLLPGLEGSANPRLAEERGPGPACPAPAPHLLRTCPATEPSLLSDSGAQTHPLPPSRGKRGPGGRPVRSRPPAPVSESGAPLAPRCLLPCHLSSPAVLSLSGHDHVSSVSVSPLPFPADSGPLGSWRQKLPGRDLSAPTWPWVRNRTKLLRNRVSFLELPEISDPTGQSTRNVSSGRPELRGPTSRRHSATLAPPLPAPGPRLS